MKERPILLSGPDVHAILEGRKTQTRRVVKDAHGAFWDHGAWLPVVEAGRVIHWEHGCWDPEDGLWGSHGPEAVCPFGAPGDRLWVRETWKVSSESNHYPTDEKRLYVNYRAGAVAGAGQQQSKFSIERDAKLAASAWGKGSVYSWRPSIHMPRWASRITLEITDIRVERTKDTAPNPWVWVIDFKRV